jgi:membrane protein implicated in regulation of membrane protease activity
MLFLLFDALQDFVNVMGGIMLFFFPFLSPIGAFMVAWISAVLSVAPQFNIAFYIVICVILVIVGIIVNSYWPGDKPIAGESKYDENLLEERSTDTSEEEGEDSYK